MVDVAFVACVVCLRGWLNDTTVALWRLNWNFSLVASHPNFTPPDPFKLRDLAGGDKFPSAFNTRLDSMRRDGTTMKVHSIHLKRSCWQQPHPDLL